MKRPPCRILLFFSLLALGACTTAIGSEDDAMVADGGIREDAAVSIDGAADAPFDSNESDSNAADASADNDAGADAGAPCPCFVGDGPYCGRRAQALAAEQGCSLPILEGHLRDQLACMDGEWTVADECADRCRFTEDSVELDDECVLPVCDCFVLSAYCGSGAQAVADERGCRIPLLPEHNNDILYCPGGEWGVRTVCDDGCHSAPAGTADYCESDSSYALPFRCGTSARVSSGNNTSNHSGKDAYAYDFAMAAGTSVRAMRAGRVLRVRNVSEPGDACYNGGGSACANLANTVEILHDDGTVGLYMHIRRGTVSSDMRVAAGDEIARSGNSGWSTGPHLHVQVQRNCGIWWCQSVPLTFKEARRVRTGDTVTSGNCP